MRWISGAFGRYAGFRGRARRREYWLFMLGYAVVNTALQYGVDSPTPFRIFLIAVVVPCLSMTVRRLHDSGHTAYSLLLPLIPVVGWVIVVVYLCGDSENGINRHGPSPKFQPVYA